MLRYVLGLAAIFLAIALGSYAADALTIGPSRFEVTLPPGEIAVADYYCQNETEEDVHVKIEPEHWFKEAYIYGDLKIEDWLSFNIYEFDLKPKEIKKLKLTIKIPRNVKGEIVSQIFFSTDAKGSKISAGGMIQVRLGAVLYVAIKGTEVVDGAIESIEVMKIEPPAKADIKLGILFKNKGNVHLNPMGNVIILNTAEEKAAEFETLKGATVHPNREGTHEAIYNGKKLVGGSYKVKISMKYGEIFGEPKTATYEANVLVDESGGITVK